MKILFLDIDGVLNSRAYDRRRDWTTQSGIDETRLPLVKSIVDATGAHIVLSSTWRVHWDKDVARCDSDGEYINRMLAKYGLAVFDKTPDLGLHAVRKDEIAAWLHTTDEQVERFAILDDDPFGWDELSECFIKTNPHFGLGLEEEHVAKAIAVLRGELQ